MIMRQLCCRIIMLIISVYFYIPPPVPLSTPLLAVSLGVPITLNKAHALLMAIPNMIYLKVELLPQPQLSVVFPIILDGNNSLYFKQHKLSITSITVVILLFLLCLTYSFSCSSEAATVVSPPLAVWASALMWSLWSSSPIPTLLNRTSLTRNICKYRQTFNSEKSDFWLLFIMYSTNLIICKSFEFEQIIMYYQYSSIDIHIFYVCISSHDYTPKGIIIQQNHYVYVHLNCIPMSSALFARSKLASIVLPQLGVLDSVDSIVLEGSVCNSFKSLRLIETMAAECISDSMNLVVGIHLSLVTSGSKSGQKTATQVDRRPG